MKLACSERCYAPPKHPLLKQADFRRSEIVGGETDVWSRDIKLTHEHFKMLIAAVKWPVGGQDKLILRD